MVGRLTGFYQKFSLSNLSALQISQLLRYGTFILIGICFAKLQVPLSDIGSFETFIMLSGMLSFFWVSGLVNSMLSLYPKKDELEKKELLFNVFISLILLSALAAAALLAFSQDLLSFLDKQENSSVIEQVVIYLLLSCPSFLIEYILFLNNRNKAIVYYALASSFATLIAVVIPIAFQYPVEVALYGMIAVAAAKLLVTTFLLQRFAVFRLNVSLLLSHFRISTPLLASIFVSGSAEYIDGVIVKAKFDDVSFAVFRYGARELPVLLIVANTLSAAMVPSIANNLNEGLANLRKQSTRLMHLFFPLTIILLLTSRYIYQYIFSESFIYSAVIFNIYLLLIIPRVLFPQTILTGLQHTRFLLLSSILEIVINVFFSLWLSDRERLGLPGIAVGTLIAYLFDKIFLVGVNYWMFKIKPNDYLHVRLFGIYTLCTLLAFGAGYFLIGRSL